MSEVSKDLLHVVTDRKLKMLEILHNRLSKQLNCLKLLLNELLNRKSARLPKNVKTKNSYYKFKKLEPFPQENHSLQLVGTSNVDKTSL